jgi:phosphoribosyl-ATP pyrophosphohydrolase
VGWFEYLVPRLIEKHVCELGFNTILYAYHREKTNVSPNDTLDHLAHVIEMRRSGDPEKSYVARLFHKGVDAILKKVGEEATEVVMAAKDGDTQKIVYEVADLWFHSMIALAQFGLKPSDVLAELQRREGLSGLEEFAARKAISREQEPKES